MTAQTLALAEFATELSPEAVARALIAGPCALPVAPLAMPQQVIEAERGWLRRLFGALIPRPSAAPTTGTGL